jgi:RHS repeat-associated protein
VAWRLQTTRGEVVLRATGERRVFQIEGTSEAVDLLFGGGDQLKLVPGSEGHITAVPVRASNLRLSAAPTSAVDTGAPALMSHLFSHGFDVGLAPLLLNRVSPSTAEIPAASPGEVVGSITDSGGPILLIATTDPRVLQLRGEASDIRGLFGSSEKVPLAIGSQGQFYLATNPPPDLMNRRDGTYVCQEWAYSAAAVAANDAPAARKPATARVVHDLYGVVRTGYYDEGGRLLREVSFDAKGAQIGRADYNYSHGVVSGIRYPAGDRICREIDPLGRVAALTRLPAPNYPGDQQPQMTLFRYDDRLGLFSLGDIIIDPYTETAQHISLTPDNWGRPTKISRAVNKSISQTTSFTYNDPAPAGPSSKTNPDNTIVTFANPTPQGPRETTIANTGIKLTQDWDQYGHQTLQSRTGRAGTRAKFDDRGLLTLQSRQDVNWNWLDAQYSYNHSHQLQKIVTPRFTRTLKFNSLGNLDTVTDTPDQALSEPRTTCYNYGPDGRLLAIVLPEGNMVQYSYDEAERLRSITRGTPESIPSWARTCAHSKPANNAGAWEEITSYKYDQGGFLTGMTKEGIHYDLISDGFGRIIDAISTVDGNFGKKIHIRRGYDSRNRVIWEASYDENAPGDYSKPQALTPALHAMTEYSYDYLDRVIELARWRFSGNPPQPDPKGLIAKTTLSYQDDAGKVTIADTEGSKTENHYDAAGRVTQRTLGIGSDEVAVIDFAYAPGDKRATVTYPAPTPAGKIIRNQSFDALGLISQVTDEKETVLFSESHDEDGHPVSTFRLGIGLRNLSYDEFGRIISQEGLTSANRTSRTAFIWDGNDRLVSISDPNGNATTYEYDSLDRLSVESNALGSIRYEYDPGSSRQKHKTDMAQTERTISYDGLGRVSLDQISDGPAMPFSGHTTTRTFTYTPLGQLATATVSGNPDITVSFGYDSLGRRITETNSILPLSVSHTYDITGQPFTTTILQNGQQIASISNAYDSIHRLKSVALNGTPIVKLFNYGGIGSPTKITYGSGALAIITRNSRNSATGVDITLADRLIASQHDALGSDAVSRQRNRQFSNSPTITDLYEVDDAGRVTAENLARVALPLAGDDLSNADVDPLFDKQFAWSVFTMDSASNWVNRDGAGGFKPTVDNFNRFTSIDGSNVGYDTGGNLTTFKDDKYEFDGLGQLITADRNGEKQTFVYDALGRRILETDKLSSTFILWDGPNIAALGPRSDASQARLRVGGTGLDEHLALVDRLGAGPIAYLHQATDGSILAASDDKGLIEGYAYSAFGETNVLDPQGANLSASKIGNRFLFQGQLYDPILGFYSMRSREYKPGWGRFLSPDPIGLAGGINRYAFVMGRSLTHTDPSGLGDLQSDLSYFPAIGPIMAAHQLWQEADAYGDKFPDGVPVGWWVDSTMPLPDASLRPYVEPGEGFWSEVGGKLLATVWYAYGMLELRTGLGAIGTTYDWMIFSRRGGSSGIGNNPPANLPPSAGGFSVLPKGSAAEPAMISGFRYGYESQGEIILGNLPQTMPLAGQPGTLVVKMPEGRPWSPNFNAGVIRGGMERGATFRPVSEPFNSANLYYSDPGKAAKFGPRTVFGNEMGQLWGAFLEEGSGYTWDGQVFRPVRTGEASGLFVSGTGIVPRFGAPWRAPIGGTPPSEK